MVVYCTAQDVQNILQRRKAFTDTSSPSKDFVDDLIEQNEDNINSQTGHSWKEDQVVERYLRAYTTDVGGWMLKYDFGNRKIKILDFAQGDKIEVYISDRWVNYLDPAEGKLEGKRKDYDVNLDMGLLYVRKWTQFSDQVRVTFRYGESDVVGNIRKLCTMWTAADVLDMYEQALTTPEDGSVTRQGPQVKAENFRKMIFAFAKDWVRKRTLVIFYCLKMYLSRKNFR